MSNHILSRRQFTKTALALPLVLPAWAQAPRRVPHFASRFGGVRVGAQTYCYRSLRDTTQPWSAARVDQLFVQNQIDLAEFWIALIEPPGGPGRGPTDPVMRRSPKCCS